ncbi:MAG TPA: prolipoprotein diacylglyceryl transferase [Anaerolineales bacterium]|jgi:phosphatidylglycerol:prolipoprotein diacylglycerol transferase|nr:prolipoprotein diacylglyceryl transferase [Anaerolineales bacterium]
MIESFRAIFAPPRDLILLAATLWIGLALAEKRSERHGVSKEALNNLVFYSLFGYLLGGRILFALANFSAFADSPLNIFSLNVDLFDPIGGVITAILVGVVYIKKTSQVSQTREVYWKTLDALTPIFAALAIGLHLSHLAAGRAFGSPTALPWGIDLWNATRHPTQIYELIVALVIFGVIWFRNSELSLGALFLNFVALTAGARLFLEAFRGDSTLIFGGFRLAQIAAWTVLMIVFIAGEQIQKD